ncbi:RDD family protein [Nocardiopsis sp. RSe5-2]|uniref:RDD family protein n=1 Tax=Nocardiopsis endophytica TaxID=3018445 RepID=A0ABT4TWE4_9ACTN|nr:caspase family protein [Nocardiopsis endophytica]MDA2809020.1 RDD family protein [Nocardiopsis endophytica]
MTGTRRAMVVAQDDYRNPGLTRLHSPAQDAAALAHVLGDPAIGGFEVEVVHNAAAHEVARQVETFFASGGREDALLLHFSCHGLKNTKGELFFAAYDTDPELLRSTAVPAQFVRECIQACRARNSVLFLDCCFGGAFMKGMGLRASNDAHVLDTFSEEAMNSGRGWAVVTASSAMEYAFEDGRLAEDAHPKPSVFTSALVDALTTGEADRNEDGLVSLDELYDHLYDRVHTENPNQTPSCSMHVQGDVYLARSTRNHRVLKGLPRDLADRLLDKDPGVRRQGLARLEALATGSDTEAAERAHAALAWVAEKDVGALKADARHVLDGLRITPLPAVLKFGRIAQGAARPTRTVQLLGPPLARRCEPHPHSPVLHVEPQADALDGLAVTLDTTRLGAVDTAVTLSGPTGEVEVMVTAEIVPAETAEPPRTPAPGPHTGPGPAMGAAPPRPQGPFPPGPALAPAAVPTGPQPPHGRVRPDAVRPGPPTGAPVRPHRPGAGRRMGARLIDFTLVGVFGWGLAFFTMLMISAFTAPENVESDFDFSRPFDVLMSIWLVWIFVGWGPLMFLYDALLLGSQGRTIGMAATGVCVVDAVGGHRPPQRQIMIRAAVFGLPQSIPVVGQLFVLFESLALIPDPRKQALHDRLAKTMVVFPPEQADQGPVRPGGPYP